MRNATGGKRFLYPGPSQSQMRLLLLFSAGTDTGSLIFFSGIAQHRRRKVRFIFFAVVKLGCLLSRFTKLLQQQAIELQIGERTSMKVSRRRCPMVVTQDDDDESFQQAFWVPPPHETTTKSRELKSGRARYRRPPSPPKERRPGLFRMFASSSTSAQVETDGSAKETKKNSKDHTSDSHQSSSRNKSGGRRIRSPLRARSPHRQRSIPSSSGGKCWKDGSASSSKNTSPPHAKNRERPRSPITNRTQGAMAVESLSQDVSQVLHGIRKKTTTTTQNGALPLQSSQTRQKTNVIAVTKEASDQRGGVDRNMAEKGTPTRNVSKSFISIVDGVTQKEDGLVGSILKIPFMATSASPTTKVSATSKSLLTGRYPSWLLTPSKSPSEVGDEGGEGCLNEPNGTSCNNPAHTNVRGEFDKVNATEAPGKYTRSVSMSLNHSSRSLSETSIPSQSQRSNGEENKGATVVPHDTKSFFNGQTVEVDSGTSVCLMGRKETLAFYQRARNSVDGTSPENHCYDPNELMIQCLTCGHAIHAMPTATHILCPLCNHILPVPSSAHPIPRSSVCKLHKDNNNDNNKTTQPIAALGFLMHEWQKIKSDAFL